MKLAPLVLLPALLLASCGPQNGAVTPDPAKPSDPDALTDPAAPVLGKATEVQNASQVVGKAGETLAAMVNPSNPDFDPDLLAVVNAIPGSSGTNTPFGALGLGRSPARGVRPLTSTAVLKEMPLITGTYTLDAAGMWSRSPEPTTGYVLKDLRKGSTLTVNWHDGGAATVWAEVPQPGGVVRQELPTRASATFTRGTARLAAAQFGMTPGNCLGTGGPDALSLSAWAGREQNSPAALNLQYAWTSAGITLKADATYRTQAHTAQAGVDLNLQGTTAGRCTPATLAFTPTRADLTVSAEVPNSAVKATLNLRKLNNLVISGAELKAASPFGKVTGDLSAAVTHNGQPMLSAFGPLGDGPDTDLLPGDAVVVRYIENGRLVETNLAAVYKRLFP